MITRIEIDGFKTFQEFSLDLGPMRCIVGPNWVGKRDLFRALRLLGRLASTDLASAFHESHAASDEFFRAQPQGATRGPVRLACSNDRPLRTPRSGRNSPRSWRPSPTRRRATDCRRGWRPSIGPRPPRRRQRRPRRRCPPACSS